MKQFKIYRQIRDNYPVLTCAQAWIIATAVVALGGEPLPETV